MKFCFGYYNNQSYPICIVCGEKTESGFNGWDMHYDCYKIYDTVPLTKQEKAILKHLMLEFYELNQDKDLVLYTSDNKRYSKDSHDLRALINEYL